MAVQAKICGINSPQAMTAAVDGGAAFVGLVFYPPSPRAVTPDMAARLAAPVPGGIIRTGLYVDAEDSVFEATVGPVGLDLLQLHGDETAARVREIRDRFGVPVMKVVKVAGPGDLDGADGWAGVADRLLFDARPPASMSGALPGGNALAFDWKLVAKRRWPLPWMLSGGLNAANVGEAVRISGATAVDVSSGVEDRPGVKSPARITAFLDAVRAL